VDKGDVKNDSQGRGAKKERLDDDLRRNNRVLGYEEHMIYVRGIRARLGEMKRR
jgi:hypothetical protein